MEWDAKLFCLRFLVQGLSLGEGFVPHHCNEGVELWIVNCNPVQKCLRQLRRGKLMRMNPARGLGDGKSHQTSGGAVVIRSECNRTASEGCECSESQDRKSTRLNSSHT